MHSRLNVAGIAVLAVLVTGSAVRVQSPTTTGRRIVGTEAPYTVVLQETVIASDGRRRVGDKVTYAVWSNGSLAQIIDGTLRKGRILHLASGVRVETNDSMQLRSTTILDKDPGEWRRTSQSLCMGNSFGRAAGKGTDVFEDRGTVGELRAVRISSAVSTWWYAVDVGCAPIGMEAKLPGGLRSERRLVSLVRGEPESSLITLVEAFEEVPPSKLLPPLPPDCQDRCLQQALAIRRVMDEKYESARPR